MITVTDEEFLQLVKAEIAAARAAYPAPNAMNTALGEEVGEVCKALLYEPWSRVVAEAIQVATMAMRLATEGDCTMEEWRKANVKGVDDWRELFNPEEWTIKIEGGRCVWSKIQA